MDAREQKILKNTLQTLLEIQSKRFQYLEDLRVAILENNYNDILKNAKLITGLTEEVEDELSKECNRANSCVN